MRKVELIGCREAKRLALLSRVAIASSSACENTDRSVPLGRYWRSRPLVFSLEPRCHGACGSAKETRRPVSAASSLCRAISLPSVRVRRSGAGTASRPAAKPSRAVSALASVSLIRTTLRLVRSTTVPTEERLPAPLIRSPSQCPGTLHLRWPFADDVADPAPPFAILGPPTTMRLALAQAGEQLAAQLTARHGVDRLVNRFVRHS